jgi:DNA invertase Pin-like site-specific DNA recombinase
MDLIAYYRVSTARQGQSGLGLEAQCARVQELAKARGAVVVAEFREVESGRKANRPQLAAALAEARRRGAAIVVAKLDRLARDAEFILRLSREAEVNGMAGFLFADLPEIDATSAVGRMVLTMMAALAEFEARRISERTKDALNAAKARGVRLGGARPKTLERAAQAQQRAEELRSLIAPMRERGDSMQVIAKALNAAGIPSPSKRPGVEWSVMGVKRTLERLGMP